MMSPVVTGLMISDSGDNTRDIDDIFGADGGPRDRLSS